MAVTNLGRVVGSSISVASEKASGANTKRPVQDYSVTYMLQLDDPCADEYYIGSAADLPYVGQEHPDLPGFWCVSREFTETEEPTLWTCTVNYTTKRSDVSTGKGSQGGGDSGDSSDSGPTATETRPTEPESEDIETPPWLQPGTASYSTTYVSQVVSWAWLCGINSAGSSGVPTLGNKFNWLTDANYYYTWNGSTVSSVTNSAGEPVWFEYDFPAANIELSFAVTTDKAWMAYPQYLGMLNSDTVSITAPIKLTCPPLSLKYKDLSVQQEIHDDGTKYLSITQSFEFIGHPGGHRVPLVDQGSYSWSGGRTPASTLADRVFSVDSEGNPITTNLNGAGGATGLTEGAGTIWWTPVAAVPNFIWFFNNAKVG